MKFVVTTQKIYIYIILRAAGFFFYDFTVDRRKFSLQKVKASRLPFTKVFKSRKIVKWLNAQKKHN